MLCIITGNIIFQETNYKVELANKIARYLQRALAKCEQYENELLDGWDSRVSVHITKRMA